MNISIRKHIMNNFKNTSEEEIKSSIISSVGDEEEITLPGLGVFFEILWSNSSDDDKKHITQVLHNNLK